MGDKDFDGAPALTGTIGDVTVVDPDGTPNKVVSIADDFLLEVAWHVTPPASAILLDGSWNLRAYAESIGPGPEKKIGEITVPATGVGTYSGTVKVLAGTLPADVAPDSGAYKIVCVLVYRNTFGLQTHVAAFSEGPMILVRN